MDFWWPQVCTEKVGCPLCGQELKVTDKPWRLTGHEPPKKLEPRDCACGVEAWIARGATGQPYVAVFQPNQPMRVSRSV